MSAATAGAANATKTLAPIRSFFMEFLVLPIAILTEQCGAHFVSGLTCGCFTRFATVAPKQQVNGFPGETIFVGFAPKTGGFRPIIGPNWPSFSRPLAGK